MPDRHATEKRHVEAVVEATQLVGALIAETLAAVDAPVTMPQWRALALAAQEPCPVSAIADDLGIHPSNATRLCDRLVRAGLLRRDRADGDRRIVLVSPTPAGRDLYRRAMRMRRGRIESALATLPPDDQAGLAEALTSFVAALPRPRGGGDTDRRPA